MFEKDATIATCLIIRCSGNNWFLNFKLLYCINCFFSEWLDETEGELQVFVQIVLRYCWLFFFFWGTTKASSTLTWRSCCCFYCQADTCVCLYIYLNTYFGCFFLNYFSSRNFWKALILLTHTDCSASNIIYAISFLWT